MRRAFTLVEMLVAIGIIGLLVALALPVLSHVRRKARADIAAADLQSVDLALHQWMQLYGKGCPPQPLCDDDVNELAQALESPGAAWFDGVDGPGALSRISFVSSSGGAVPDKIVCDGSPVRPFIANRINHCFEMDNPDARLRYQATLLTSDGGPILYVPLVNGAIPKTYNPGYVDADGVDRAVSRLYATHGQVIPTGATYMLRHPGPDGDFYRAGAVDDDVVTFGN